MKEEPDRQHERGDDERETERSPAIAVAHGQSHRQSIVAADAQLYFVGAPGVVKIFPFFPTPAEAASHERNVRPHDALL